MVRYQSQLDQFLALVCLELDISGITECADKLSRNAVMALTGL